ncbi:hypothetical protein E2562_029038 [Oryza meyeriana var. granulata]|uniref:Transcription repressor n=1 Tax=Oryza meyeriana var. granulata TaxID=110450 RepID=A0A6G1E4D2_9ORYZ|nr:hypothetical protein E2562_029038 [Oryza meyeriana var. granulata]
MVIGRLALSSLFHNKARDTSPSPPPAPANAPPWVWPSCKNNPRTQSFRAGPPPQAPGARTIASVFLDSAEYSFTTSSARHDCSDSLSTASEASATGAEADTADDAIVRGLRSSDRLLFDPSASATSSILDEKSAGAGGEAFIGGVAVAFESEDPYVDFRASMEEMVAADGVGDWGWLEEMLRWYLQANGKDTHAAILAAFIDVIVAIADPALASCSSERSSSCAIAESSSLEVAEKAKLAV